MKILYVTNMYPNPKLSYMGIHVKEQIECVAQYYGIDHEIYFINGLESKLNYVKSIFQVNWLMRKERFDIVHVHFGLSGLFLLFNPLVKVPVVLTLHGDDINSSKLGGLMRAVSKVVVRMVNRTIILNDTMSLLLDRYKYKLVKIPCGVNVGQFNRLERVTNETFTIGFPGDRNRPEKNFPLFESIIRELAALGVHVKIVEFHNLTRRQVADQMNEIDCLLLTSIREGSPQIIKEAMACGLPIISTPVGDIKDLLEGVTNCQVIDSFDPKNFIIPIKMLVELPPEERLTNGREKLVSMELDAMSVARRIYNLYNEVI